MLPHLVWELTNNGEGLYHLDGRRMDPDTVWVRLVHTLTPACSLIPSTWNLGNGPLYFQRCLYMRFTLPVDDEHNIVYGWRVHGEGFPGGDPSLMGPNSTDMEGQLERPHLSQEEIQKTPDDFQAQGTLWGGQTLPYHNKEHMGTSDIGVALMRKTFRNILDGKIPEAFPKPASEEPDGPKVRTIYSFDTLVKVPELPDKDADFQMIGKLAADLAEAAIEIADTVPDQAERDEKTREAFKKVEAAYQAKH